MNNYWWHIVCNGLQTPSPPLPLVPDFGGCDVFVSIEEIRVGGNDLKAHSVSLS